MDDNDKSICHKHPKSKSNHCVGNEGKLIPKIKLRVNDKSSDFRSISLPRLKDFLPGEMRKIDEAPRPNVSPFLHSLPESQSQPPTSENNSNDLNIGQSDDSPSVAFLPNSFQNYNQAISQSNLHTPQEYFHDQVECTSPNYIGGDQITPESQYIQLENNPNDINETPGIFICEKQPVGGRNAVIHQLQHQAKSKQPRQSYEFHHRRQTQQVRCGCDSCAAPQQEYPPRRQQNSNRIDMESIKFSPAMIRDQEMLVRIMKQQGIREDIMKRQFDALLNEQRRQLICEQQMLQEEDTSKQSSGEKIYRQRRINKIEENNKPEWMAHITPSWVPYALAEQMKENENEEKKKTMKIDDENCHCNAHYNPALSSMNIPTTPGDNRITMKTKYQKNNGLQDIETVEEAMEELKKAGNYPGYEYLENLKKKDIQVKLNGMHSSDDPLIQNLPCRFKPEDATPEVKRGISANGLENRRNLNNPLPPPFRHMNNPDHHCVEYPKQRINNNDKHCHFTPDEKENGTIAMPQRIDMSQLYQQPRIIGGVKYFVRPMQHPPHSPSMNCEFSNQPIVFQ